MLKGDENIIMTNNRWKDLVKTNIKCTRDDTIYLVIKYLMIEKKKPL